MKETEKYRAKQFIYTAFRDCDSQVSPIFLKVSFEDRLYFLTTHIFPLENFIITFSLICHMEITLCKGFIFNLENYSFAD